MQQNSRQLRDQNLASIALLSAIAYGLLGFTPAWADLTVKAVEAGQEVQSRLSHLKRRVDAALPGVGPNVSIITRLDLGLEWIVDHQNSTYEEHALSGAPEDKDDAAPEDLEAVLEEPESEIADEAQTSCEADISRTSQTDTIAGLKTAAWKIVCKDEAPAGMTLWVAEPQGALAEAVAEGKQFIEAYARLEAVPPAPSAWLVSAFLAEELMHLVPDADRLPEGLPLAAEGPGEPEAGNGPAAHVRLVEVTALNTDPIDPAVFEIPSEFTRVARLADTGIQ